MRRQLGKLIFKNSHETISSLSARGFYQLFCTPRVFEGDKWKREGVANVTRRISGVVPLLLNRKLFAGVVGEPRSVGLILHLKLKLNIET